MENHFSEKQPMVIQNQQSSEHIINNEHVTPSISFQDTMDDVHLTSTRTNSIFLSTPSNDVSMECQNNYESNHNNSTTTNDQRYEAREDKLCPSLLLSSVYTQCIFVFNLILIWLNV